MNLKEFYEAVGGNYDDTVTRLMNESIVKKFVTLFTDDKSYNDFLNDFNNEKYEDAFRDIHTLKGLSLNLGFDTLSNICITVTDALRDGKMEVTSDMLSKLESAYNMTCENIKKLD